MQKYTMFTIKKKTEYERLPIDEGGYIVLAEGSTHGMSVTDNDWFNGSNGKGDLLLIKVNGALIYTSTIILSKNEYEYMHKNGYIYKEDE